MLHTTIQFKKKHHHDQIKVLALITDQPIGELLDQIIDKELNTYTKSDIILALKKHPKEKRLLTAWG